MPEPVLGAALLAIAEEHHKEFYAAMQGMTESDLRFVLMFTLLASVLGDPSRALTMLSNMKALVKMVKT